MSVVGKKEENWDVCTADGKTTTISRCDIFIHFSTDDQSEHVVS